MQNTGVYHASLKLTLVEYACVERYDKIISHISQSDRCMRERKINDWANGDDRKVSVLTNLTLHNLL